MQANFDEITLIELERFDKQVQSNIMMNEYIADVENTARNLYADGMLRDEQEDPIKLFFHTSLRSLSIELYHTQEDVVFPACSVASIHAPTSHSLGLRLYQLH